MKNKVLFLAAFTSVNALAASTNGFEVSYWGFLKTSAMYASEGLASYNNINLSAPTHAVGHLAGRSDEKRSRMSAQTQQSRIGFGLKKDENLSGKFEFDFIDFSKSSPTTQMVPRVRIASMTYAWNRNKVIIGQDWDLFSPVTSYTYDYVGLYFLAGNTGFMRQQAQFIHDMDQWEVGAAVGLAGNNPGVIDTNLETAKSPSYSMRILRKLENGRVGISGIYAHLHYDSNDTGHDAYAGNAFYEKNFGRFEIKSEAYYGQNLANIGSLAIGKGTATSNVKEFGGTLTGLYKLTDQHFIFGGVGTAKVDNKSQLTPLSIGTPTANVISDPGIRSNFLSRVGFDYRITPDFSWISEVSRYETNSKVAASEYQLNTAYSLESGIQLRF